MAMVHRIRVIRAPGENPRSGSRSHRRPRPSRSLKHMLVPRLLHSRGNQQLQIVQAEFIAEEPAHGRVRGARELAPQRPHHHVGNGQSVDFEVLHGGEDVPHGADELRPWVVANCVPAAAQDVHAVQHVARGDQGGGEGLCVKAGGARGVGDGVADDHFEGVSCGSH